MESDDKKRRTVLDFAHEHPIATLLIVWAISDTLIEVAKGLGPKH